jgi:hypothetical protein
MPMTALEADTLTAIFALCKTVITDLQPRLQALQQQYDAEGGVADTLTQADLDDATHLSGLQKQSVDDGVYVLTTVMLPGIVNGYASLAQLASRSRGMAPPPPSFF